ncbi:S66 peptidase family protein [Kitasatospora sp. NPDC001527]|uniref:S66 peptidase family protein n=1 Tax=Kitasatospora sp. NPDC001527 TaxID=3154519 RepID=UPI0033293801
MPSTPDVLRPRALAPGDLVAVAAPSGPLEAEAAPLLERGVATLTAMGFRVRRTPLTEPGRRRWWAAAGPDAQAEEFNRLLRDPEVRAIVAHSGGQATAGWLDRLDVDAVRADPKPVLGCSDVSLLLLALHARTGLAGLHGDIATYGLGDSWHTAAVPTAGTPADTPADTLADLYRRALTDPATPLGPLPELRTSGGWECWRPGRAAGPLLGGLLKRLVPLQATPYALPAERFDGAVLFWEDVDRPLSAVWQDLHLLRLSGVLDRIAAMVVGVPHRLTAVGCADDAPVPSLREVVLDVLGDRPLPVLGQVDLGHAGPNLPLPLGVRATVDATARALSLDEPAVGPR